MIPGIEHDLYSLRTLNAVLRNTAEGVLREYDTKYSHWIWPLILVFSIIIILSLEIRHFKKIKQCLKKIEQGCLLHYQISAGEDWNCLCKSTITIP